MTFYPKSTLRESWWETSAGVLRPYLKAWGITLADLINQLDFLQTTGFDAVEIFAPCKGGLCYNGLDTLDPYEIDPALGTIGDFQRLLTEAHTRGMAITVFINLGYSHEQSPAFLKACADIGQGVDSLEARRFVWSETGDDVLDASNRPDFLNGEIGHWWYNETAKRYYWVRWEGKHGGYHLPQHNFADPGWQEEARKIVDFWLGTGIDGIVLDAVKWYIHCNWDIVLRTMTELIRSADNQLIHPEGVGSWQDDPVPWIGTGGFNCITDYALKLGREERDVIRDAIISGDPRSIEHTLRAYRDRIAASGGICYLDLPDLSDAPPAAQALGAAVIGFVGQWFVAIADVQRWSQTYRDAIQQILLLRGRFPSLCARGGRQILATSDDSKYYAFVREALPQSPAVVVVMNFQPEETLISIDLGAEPIRLKSVTDGSVHQASTSLEITIPPYGYKLWTIDE